MHSLEIQPWCVCGHPLFPLPQACMPSSCILLWVHRVYIICVWVPPCLFLCVSQFGRGGSMGGRPKEGEAFGTLPSLPLDTPSPTAAHPLYC